MKEKYTASILKARSNEKRNTLCYSNCLFNDKMNLCTALIFRLVNRKVTGEPKSYYREQDQQKDVKQQSIENFQDREYCMDAKPGL